MNTTMEQLIELAMELAPAERARLANILVESLDTGGLSEEDRNWIADIRRHRDEAHGASNGEHYRQQAQSASSG